MQISDFSIFVFLPILLVPLTLIYVSLKRFGWYEDQLFLDTWIIFLVYLCAWIVDLILLIALTKALEVYWSISEFVWIFLNFLGTFVISILSIGCLLSLKRLSREKMGYSLLGDKELVGVTSIKPDISRISILTTTVVFGVSVLVFCGIATAAKIYDHYYPKPEIQYGIYDI